MNPIPIQSSAFSSSGQYSPIGTKLHSVQGYDTDKPTVSFSLEIQMYGASANQTLTYTFIGIKSGRKINVAKYTPCITSTASAPAALGETAVVVTPLGGATTRLYYAKN